MSPRPKRILTDTAGYLLVIFGVAFGWIPGPGGIPLILAGLGLLSINNMWAKRWREWLLRHSGDFIKWIFPKHKIVEDLYDLTAVLLIGLVAYLVYLHAAVWQITLASILFFAAITIVGFNRDRANSLKSRFGRRRKSSAG